MKGTTEVGEHKLTEDFEEFNRDFDINITDDQELWLIKWPLNSIPDINGQAVSLELHNNGLLSTFESSTGKLYEAVSYKSQDPDATVFLPSSSGCKIVGKISRQVSILHYPDPKGLAESDRSISKKMAERSVASSLTNSANRYSTPTSGIRSRYSGPSTSSRSRGTSKFPSRSLAGGAMRSIDSSLQDSGRENSNVTSSGASLKSQERKSKKRKSVV